ncbi:DNA polymeras-like protein epsilon [Piedraia hortae CBS 480.64]|uniref:DNA polymerase epsilon catalytic subunit n=1 Tax=Piedraia hortae CBS 480.64 TaxID=1314780 RepID=A0A6A7C3Y8_9PEZI|nr:DNA polymeras-like protein epsilon [Piedraia hortae CBS 480.64]
MASRNRKFGANPPRTIATSSLRTSEQTSRDEKTEAVRLAHSLDEAQGFPRFDSGRKPRVGWLINFHSTSIEDGKTPFGRAGVDFYFLGEEEGESFKATVEYPPYFLVGLTKGKEGEVEEFLKRKFEGSVKSIERVEKEDLKMANHLLGHKRGLLKLEFQNVNDLLAVRRVIAPLVQRNKSRRKVEDVYADLGGGGGGVDLFDDAHLDDKRRVADAGEYISDLREYDVPYHVRVAIDLDIRVGKWYEVQAKHGRVELKCLEERLTRADPVVLAWDIETTKLPLKFPDASFDQIMMISYMIDGTGFLITNREIVSEDIADFEYTPKPEFEGPFVVFNEPNEEGVITKFFECIKEAKPTIMVTYNGDFFDWPFVEARACVHGIDMYREIGFRKNSEDVYQSTHCAHMDAFAWVNRDSYLPQGSRGLKAVTTAKLGYDPDELDPELMTPYAAERPQVLAEYSVSDAVATYYLYMKYVHPFIFSLCTIIPLGPDDVLRKGTGTLCEMLLMVQAYQKNIVLPNKHEQPQEAFWEGHLLESETYVGGHVESIEAGVFRSDIACDFSIDTTAVDELLNDLDAALTFSITVEEKKKMEDIANYEDVKAQIVERLMQLKEEPKRHENPSIYHLDVASMYPNIMTTNRLQPDSMIDESVCAACDFNRPGKTCDRRMPWAWRGEFLPAKKSEYNMIRHALENEKFPGKYANSLPRSFQDLSIDEQASLVKKRLAEYSKKIYHKIHDARTIEREAIICQRENPFYVDTVKDFRDRRYDFKGKQKDWKGKASALEKSGAPANEVDEAKKMIVLYDSLQLAHKVILNSFYGYVMRKGSRWYSMEMAGVTCLTGARIIQMARQLVERIGRPLELDTDGIWCILPKTFPEDFTFTLQNGKKMTISYPCVMLNHLVHARFTNHQYQTLVDPATFRYEAHSDNTIFFEVDGPYRAMILPTSKEEDKNLKKRYAVFNHNGSLAELKGFEVKRRGELKLIKIFQQQIFNFFLEGSTLEETYESVAKVANKWLDVLYGKGATLADEELIDLICENKSMTKTLEEYGAQKSTAITTAKRLAEFLGEQMVKDKGLNCKYIIAGRPKNAPVTERAIPVAIYSAEESVKRYYLRKWMKEDPGDMDPRSAIDWNYYLERLGSVIQKLITIPAALQKVCNPVPRVAHPDWLDRRIRMKDDTFKQQKMTDMFAKKPLTELDPNSTLPRSTDIEDFGGTQVSKLHKPMAAAKIVPANSQKRKADAASGPVNLFDALPSVMPSMTEDYQGWLRYQKQKWNMQKVARQRRRQLFGEKRADDASGIGTLFRQQAATVYSADWQILQLREGEIPGEVKAFVLIDQKVHQLKIQVPRQIFVNLKEEELPDVEVDNVEVEKVLNWTLPNGHSSTHLFKLTMKEEVYVHEADNMGKLFNHPSVEGVYERRIPFNIRAMLDLGCVCTFDESQKGVLGKGLEQGFDLSALKSVIPKQPYMTSAAMNYLALYHVVAGERNVFALFSSSKPEAKIVLLSRARGEQGMPNLDRLYEELLRQRQEGQSQQDVIDYPASLHFQTVQVTTERRAYQEVNDAMKKMRDDDTSATMMVLRSNHSQALMQHLPSLQNYPILQLTATEADKQLPPLGWQTVVAKRLIGHYLDLGHWIQHLQAFASYGNIPLCNLQGDDPRFLIDIAYARKLQQEKVVLWWSDDAKPDHGGHEKDDILGNLEAVDIPTVNNPGTYSSVCIDINVKNLAINTILSSAVLNDAEGEASNPPDDDTAVASVNAFSPSCIDALREMVRGWWQEACTGSGSAMADLLVQHLLRYIESPSSHLYDRNLQYYVQVMSRKAFQHLISSFRRFGSHIVFANSGRILLQTSKSEVGNAYAYSQYILKTISTRPAFHFLDLNITEYWDYLIWYDEFNYGGKGCVEITSEEEQTLETIMHWQMASFLPVILQPQFSTWVVEFINIMHARKASLPLHQPQGEEGEESTRPGTGLSQPFSKPLLKAITQLLKRQKTEQMHPDLAEDWTFPSLPGSHLNLTNPVLELVKMLMQVLMLNQTTGLEVRVLRKQLLQLFGIREFAPEGGFANPSTMCVIRELVCPECCVPRDVDLCRDGGLTGEVASGDGGAGGGVEGGMSGGGGGGAGGDSTTIHHNTPPALPPFHPKTALLSPFCENCNAHTFSPLSIEERLLSDIQRLVTSWITQDLKCERCGNVRTNELLVRCACAGEWVPTVEKSSLEGRLNVLTKVAGYYGLEMVGSLLGEVGR